MRDIGVQGWHSLGSFLVLPSPINIKKMDAADTELHFEGQRHFFNRIYDTFFEHFYPPAFCAFLRSLSQCLILRVLDLR